VCVFSTSETCVAFFQATLQSPAHSELDLAPSPDCAWETLVLHRKRAGEKAIRQPEGPEGALSIQPFERSRGTYAVAYGF
jgi:hypothetical protein